MRINGKWRAGDDGVLRPIINAELLLPDDSWVTIPLLVDSGADQTVLEAGVAIPFPIEASTGPQLSGVGGQTSSRPIHTKLRLTEENGGKATIEGTFLALTEPEELDMSVLGRDVLNLFACISDFPDRIVALLTGKHRYRIVEEP